MNLALHLFLHVLTACIAGYTIWRFWREPIFSFGGALLGGVLIDLDHLIDYFLAFGWNFHLERFLSGAQFEKNDKIYVLFHGWEYVILLAIVAWLIKRNIRIKVAILALSLGAFFHLLIDVNNNHGMTVKGYSAWYRHVNAYRMEDIVTAEHYKQHLQKSGSLNRK